MILADAVDTAIRFVTNVYYVYLFMIFIYILLAWFRLPYSRWLGILQTFLSDIVSPYLGIFRRLLPMLRLGMFDLSPIVAILALSAIWRVAVLVIAQLH